jgi:hypothetical protein
MKGDSLARERPQPGLKSQCETSCNCMGGSLLAWDSPLPHVKWKWAATHCWGHIRPRPEPDALRGLGLGLVRRVPDNGDRSAHPNNEAELRLSPRPTRAPPGRMESGIGSFAHHPVDVARPGGLQVRKHRLAFRTLP